MIIIQLQQAAPSASAPATGAMEFKPSKGGAEIQSGVALMTEAYAAIWLLVFAMVFVTMRRLRKLDARIDRLNEEISKARDAG